MTLPAPKRTFHVLTILVLLLFAATVSAQEEAAKLVLASGAVSAGGEVEIEVKLDESGSRVSALTFVIDYDTSKLALDPDPRARVTFELPSGFVGHTFSFPDEGRLGIAIFDPDAPLSVIPDGLLARIRFRVLPEAEGTAAFAIEPSASAADGDAALVPLIVPVDPLGVTLPGSSSAPRRMRPAGEPSGSESSGASAETKWAIPIIISAADRGWRTRLELTNQSDEPAVVELVTAGLIGSPVHARFMFSSRESRVIESVSEALALDAANGPAAVVLTASSRDLRVNATLEHTGARIPVVLPAVKWDDLAAEGEARTVVAREVLRTEPSTLAIVNVGEESAMVRIVARDERGDVIHRQIVSVGGGMSAVIDLVTLTASLDREVLLIEMISTGSRVLGYLVQRDRILGRPQIRTAQ